MTLRDDNGEYQELLRLLRRRGAVCLFALPATSRAGGVTRTLSILECWPDPVYPHSLIVHILPKGKVELYTSDTPRDIEQIEQLLNSEAVAADTAQ